MPRSNFLAVIAAATLAHGVSFAAALPIAPLTFDTTYTAPAGATIKISEGGDLQAALNNAQLGDTIVLQAGATFTGPLTLPNKTSGSGWIYVVSSDLASLPAPGHRVGPSDAAHMAKIASLAYNNAITSTKGSHHFRFAGIEFTPVSGAYVYQVIAIGNADTSPATLAHHIVFDRCYVHAAANENARRGIEMDGAYVAVIDSYISGFKDSNDAQGLWAYNTTGPLKIVDNYIEAAAENVLFGGADAKAASLVPADIEIRNNTLFKPLSLLSEIPAITVKNLLEFKAAKRVLVSGNTLQNNPSAAQTGFALLITPRNQDGGAPWSTTTDIAITGNTFINVGSGINIAGTDSYHPTIPKTVRVLIRNNILGVTGFGGADGRAFQVLEGGSDYTIDHNTIVNTAAPPRSPNSDLMMADTAATKVSNFTFTNNLSSQTQYGFFGAGAGNGTAALKADFTNWIFAKNVIVNGTAAKYPAGNFFPTSQATVFANSAAGDYTLAASSPYKAAGTDGADIGASLSGAGLPALSEPTPPPNFSVK
ncbi:MAG TPA: hypothetical protein VIE42_09625 [Steroidobacteraceae bacterium]|jgi:hypothetical protein